MFGNKSLPSRFYAYGAKAPVEQLDLVNDQMHKAHQYKNKIIEVERERREKVEALLRDLSPRLAEVDEAILRAEEAVAQARGAIQQASAVARKKVRPPGLVTAVKDAKAILAARRQERKELRAALFASPEWQSQSEGIEALTHAEEKRIRAESGLYWGTYLHVESSMADRRRGAPPRFVRFDGGGHLAVQVQGGLSVDEAFSGTDARLRIDPMPTGEDLSKRARLRTKVHFRVGSNDNGSPIFAVVPVVMHRPLPDDSRIKWAHLIRRRIATNYEWEVQFVVSRESGFSKTDTASDGSVSIDVGWRRKDDGNLRVCYWKADRPPVEAPWLPELKVDGCEGELVLPADWLSEMRRTQGIQSHRDDNWNEVHAKLAEFLKRDGLPTWLTEATATFPQWKAKARLAALVLQWREHRFDGDTTIYETLEAWRLRDKHLYEFEANLRGQLQCKRMDIYRKFAAVMRRSYKTAVFEALDLRDFHVLPQPEEAPADEIVRVHTRNACLSALFQCLKESMAETVKRDPKNTTKRCPACGTLIDFDRKQLRRRCPNCGEEDDQDRVACRNLETR